MNRPSLQLLPSKSSSALVLDLPVDRTEEAKSLFLANQNSEGTRAVYRNEINIFLKFTGKRIDQVRTSDILKYKSSLQGMKPATVSRKITTLKSFFRFCMEAGLIESNPASIVKLPKVSEGSPKALTLAKLKKLFNAIDKRSPRGLRDYSMFRLMIFGGLRRAEVRALDHEDLELKDGFLRVYIRNGKGNKSRHVDVDLSCHEAIRDYTEALGEDQDPSGPVFLGEVRGFKKTPGRISLSSINSRLKHYAKLSGVECSPHQLRHSYATLAEGNGAHLKDLQDSLGHSSLATTERYIQRLNDKRNPVMDFVPSF